MNWSRSEPNRNKQSYCRCLTWSNQQYTFAGAEDPRDAAGHQGCEGGGEEGAWAEAGEVVAARGGEGGGAANKNRHCGDVGEAAEGVG